jgi:hypothetical protein
MQLTGKPRSIGTAAYSIVRIAAAMLVVISACLPARVRADETTGTWTGSIEGRGNYYWERSTRVIVPTVKARLYSPDGYRIGAGYLVDAITSASIAQTGGAKDGLFTELRHSANADVGKVFDFTSTQLDLSINGTYSTEPDYKSLIYGFESSLYWNDKNSKATLFGSRVQDRVLSNAMPTFHKDLNGFTTGIDFEQVLNPSMVLSVRYQFGYLWGFLANPYRTALIGPLPHSENHPDNRVRNAVSAHFSWQLPNSNTSLHLLYGAYADSWNIAAINPEIRVYQQIGPDLVLRPRYRFYAQSAAYFERNRCGQELSEMSSVCKDIPPGAYPVGYTGPVTNDPKMAAFVTHTFGISVDYRLSFLAETVFDFARDASIDIGIDRWLSTSTYGNGIIATVGARMAF